ncbi:hypothetical protein J4435_02565 [Candidatus Woesearchaeota archaeon]|nr:hypothetical protein [Candidatus Woesearchaeota archaeon]
MELRSALATLDSDPGFAGWKSLHKDAYFSHAFTMLQDQQEDWQLGFYQHKDEKITTFVVKPHGVEMRDAEETFKREESRIEEVRLPKNALELKEVIRKANEFQQERYPKDRSMKIITLLQNLPEYGSVWNITYVTQQFNTLNMKIHPSTGEVLDHKLSSIFSFRQK